MLGIALTLLLGAWVMATRPFFGPDEAFHYLRALTITNGRILGPKYSYPPTANIPHAQRVFANHDTRTVLVPSRLSPPILGCVDGKPDLTGSCREATATGDYYPPAYFAPAAALAVAKDVDSALWLARGASAAVCLAFLLLSVLLLAGDTGWSLLGLLATVTPMVLFVGSVINPSGLELAASLALAASALRLAREPTAAPGWVWAALAVSGTVAILSWQTGPLFAIADLLVAAGLLGREGWRVLRTGNARYLSWCAFVLGGATALHVVYSRISGVAHSTFSVTPFFHSLRIGFDQLGRLLREGVGEFGLLNVPLPYGTYWIWWLLVLALVGGALWVGDRAQRLILAGVIALAVVFPVLAYAWSYRLSGFGIQGRQVLPVLMLVPLVAGEVIYRHVRMVPGRVRTRWLLGAAVVVIGLFQLFAWWIDARYWAGRPNAFWFLGHPAWQPPGGWWPWLAMAVLGTGALLALAVRVATVGDRGQPQSFA